MSGHTALMSIILCVASYSSTLTYQKYF